MYSISTLYPSIFDTKSHIIICMNMYFLIYLLQEIHSMAFKNLRILVELDLSNNNLTHLEPETFSGNERLQTLTLSHNKIASIAPYVFPLLKHLKTIDLSHNFIGEYLLFVSQAVWVLKSKIFGQKSTRSKETTVVCEFNW